MTPIELIHICAPDLAPVTIAAIVQQESGGNRFLLHDNTAKIVLRPKTFTEAAKLAHELIMSGHSVDIGLAQINSRNLPAMRLEIENVLDPCTNLRAAQSVMKVAWEQSGHDLRSALAAYNTGRTATPAGAHYSAQVFAKAGVKVPEIPGGKMPPWVNHPLWNPPDLPPVRPVITWTPAASPLKPNSNGLSPGSLP